MAPMPRTLQHHRIKGFKGGLLIGPPLFHHCERQQSLGQQMLDFAVWLRSVHENIGFPPNGKNTSITNYDLSGVIKNLSVYIA